MSAGLPKRFDPERLAAQGDRLAGVIDAASMPRLRELLAPDAATLVDVELRAFRDDAKRLVLAGSANAQLELVCQRCMEPVALQVKAAIALAVVADEEAARGLPADLDPLLLEHGEEADLPAIVEDELILALPAVPTHADVNDCGERAQYGRQAGNGEDDEFGRTARENPFAVLKKLKNGKD